MQNFLNVRKNNMDRTSILSDTINGLSNPTKSIKAVSVPSKEYPSVLTDDYDSIISYVFNSHDNLSFIEVNKNFNIALYNSYLHIDYLINFFATSIYRINSKNYTKTLYGPCLLLGPRSSNGSYQSITYETLQQVSFLMKSVY
jgi:hypothetical protein